MRSTAMYRGLPDPPSLTSHDRATLRQGAAHRDGVIRPVKSSNFDRTDKRMAKLVQMGLAIPNAHGDWYITDAGREALTSQT